MKGKSLEKNIETMENGKPGIKFKLLSEKDGIQMSLSVNLQEF